MPLLFPSAFYIDHHAIYRFRHELYFVATTASKVFPVSLVKEPLACEIMIENKLFMAGESSAFDLLKVDDSGDKYVLALCELDDMF